MRVGEHSRIAETAKLSASAPRPSSAPSGHLPPGEGMGCVPVWRGTILPSAYQRAGQNPAPTQNNYLFTITSCLNSPLPNVATKRGGSSITLSLPLISRLRRQLPPEGKPLALNMGKALPLGRAFYQFAGVLSFVR